MKKIIALFIFISVFLSGCNSTSIYSDELKIYYNNKVYSIYDSKGRNVGSSWLIGDCKKEKVQAFLGTDSEQDKTPNITAKAFEDNNLDIFLYYDYTLYCDVDFNFPDYRDGADIEKIIITPCSETDSSKDCVIIENTNDIEIIMNTLINAANLDNYQDNSSMEKAKTNDSEITIVYSDFSVAFSYGYISVNQDGEYGIYCYDLNSGNYLYTLEDNVRNILDKYGVWYR